MERRPLLLVAAVMMAGLLVTTRASPRDPTADEDLLPGWGGTDKPRQSGIEAEAMADRTGRIKVLDWNARIFMVEKFLTPEECDHIIKLSEPRLERSGVVADKGDSAVSNIRTSFGVFLDRGEDEVIKRIEERIAMFTLLPVENGEGLQVLRYQHDQKYDAHWDYFFHKDGLTNGGNRYATVLMYLVDTEEGGETVFPNVAAPGGDNGADFSACARYHLAAKPRKGDAILFHSIKTTGELERKSLHTACPVIKGTKWSAAKWIHVGHYSMGGEMPERIEQHPQQVIKPDVPTTCEDLDDLCYEWAQAGECTRNPSFMVGSRARPGKCVSSCQRCDLLTDTGAEKTQLEAKKASAEGGRVLKNVEARQT